MSALLERAAEGDQSAWMALVDRYSGLVWSVTRSFRLSRDDAAEVCQTTWLRLVEHLATIREPERLGAWLATTTRRLCLMTVRRSHRTVPSELDEMQLISPDATDDLDDTLDGDQRRVALRRAFDELPEPGKTLLRVLAADPAPSYAEAAAILGVPIGSIGPTRARCIERLRKSRHLAAVIPPALTASAG